MKIEIDSKTAKRVVGVALGSFFALMLGLLFFGLMLALVQAIGIGAALVLCVFWAILGVVFWFINWDWLL